MQDFRQLRVWAGAHALALLVYRLAAMFPSNEQFTLASQMRRAAISVSSNIAEGATRSSDKEFSRFVVLAVSSLSELHAQSLIARDLGYLSAEEHAEFEGRIDELRRRLIAFRTKLTG